MHRATVHSLVLWWTRWVIWSTLLIQSEDGWSKDWSLRVCVPLDYSTTVCRDALGRGMWGDGTRDGGRTDVRATDAWRKEGTKRQETLSVSWKHGRARMCVRKVAFYRTNGAAVGRDKLLHKATSAQRTAAVRGTVQLSHAW
ncbi:hypothetical protein TGRUB_365370 [Toxoplasma gondii RUB]|uniref:Transmembrane protein n=2 Tax=Toxoplasma gondii TaxID=5811 RepID=A0A086LIP0_TOXGO|nr:hypothetical protein TGFOU_365370 [Toxoplasma gondii FOU]KFG56508.1 hypothetical protein TGRUB_365370 [Toxoplasma gondii RUB]